MTEQKTKQIKPRRGDLLVVETVERTFILTVGTREKTWFEVYEVAGLFRDGRVRTVRSVAWSGAAERTVEGKHAILGLVKTYLLPAADVDKEAVIKAVREHTYPNSTTPMPFASLDAVRDLVRPFRHVDTSPDLGRWQPWNNGAGKRPWFLSRDVDGKTEYHDAANGRLVRYGSYESARRTADRLNGAAA